MPAATLDQGLNERHALGRGRDQQGIGPRIRSDANAGEDARAEQFLPGRIDRYEAQSDRFFFTLLIPGSLAGDGALQDRFDGIANRIAIYIPFEPGDRDEFWRTLCEGFPNS